MNPIGSQWRLKHWLLILAEFGAYQGIVQVITTAIGLVVIHSLAKHEYALYSIINGMQSACNLLADVGIGLGVSSIGGRVWADRERFGQLLNTAFGLRRQFALYSISVCVPVALWMLWRNGSHPQTSVLLCLTMVAGVLPQLGASIWQMSPQLHGQYRRLQKLDLGVAVLRGTLIMLLALTRINVVLASGVAVIANWVRVTFLRRWARDKAAPEAPIHAEDRQALLRIAYQSLPNTIFFCFQSQVTLLILSFFGNTTGIADLTALGRLGALLAVFASTFATIIAPRFARFMDPTRLMQLYVSLAGATALIVLPVVFVAWTSPGWLLFLLGPQYRLLGAETGWVILSAGIAQVASVLWTLNCAKAWIYVQSRVFIPCVVLAQIVGALCLDLRQLHGIILFNLLNVLVTVPIYAADAWLGLHKERMLSR